MRAGGTSRGSRPLRTIASTASATNTAPISRWSSTDPANMTPYPLSKSDPSTKVLITLFLSTILVSIGVAELNVYDKVKWTPDGVVQRYGPDPEPPPMTEPPPPASVGE